jgi:hypothetical protein
MDRSEIQDEIEQLKGLVKAAYIQGCRSHGETTWWGDFHKWASQHGILTSEKATEQYLNDPSEEHLEIEIFNEGGACL